MENIDRDSSFDSNHGNLDCVRQLTQELSDYKRTLRGQRRRMEDPSFHKQLQSYKNLISVLGSSDDFQNHPLRGIPHKLKMYEFAASHGIKVPEIFEVWNNASGIILQTLPDEFVLKSDGGSSSRGVIPLRRVSQDCYERIGSGETYTEKEVREEFIEGSRRGLAYGCIFAEEMIHQRGYSRSPIPDDIKIYSAYGKTMMVMLRQVSGTGSSAGIARRYLSADGTDLGAVSETALVDDGIVVPENLPDLISVANHLSSAIGIPFCRVDLYSSTRGILFGEITRAPGDTQLYTLEHDRFLGRMWLEAEARLQMDMQRGRPAGSLWGLKRFMNLYPERDAESRIRRVMNFQACRDWCIVA